MRKEPGCRPLVGIRSWDTLIRGGDGAGVDRRHCPGKTSCQSARHGDTESIRSRLPIDRVPLGPPPSGCYFLQPSSAPRSPAERQHVAQRPSTRPRAHADEFGWRGGSSTSTARGPSGEARGGRRGRPGSWRHQPRCQSRSAITPAACSTTSAASRIMSSRKRRPTIWTPTGWPPFSSAGTTAAGSPMKFIA